MMIPMVMPPRYPAVTRPKPAVWETPPDVAKQKQVKMQMQVGRARAIPQLESRTDEQLHERVQAPRCRQGHPRRPRGGALRRGGRAQYFNEALAGCHPQERPALRQMMKASLALAERRPDDLKAAMEKLGQEAPSGRQLFMLRHDGPLIPPRERGHRRPHPRASVLLVRS